MFFSLFVFVIFRRTCVSNCILLAVRYQISLKQIHIAIIMFPCNTIIQSHLLIKCMQHRHFLALTSANSGLLNARTHRHARADVHLHCKPYLPHFCSISTVAHTERLIKIDLSGHMILIYMCQFQPKKIDSKFIGQTRMWKFFILKLLQSCNSGYSTTDDFIFTKTNIRVFLLNNIYLLM